jgi:transcriptional regulator with XRE-family HTH domain
MDESDAALAEQIGANVRRVRVAAGLSLTELAAKANMTVPYLSRVENGKRSVASVATVKRIADALGVPVCGLIDPPPAPKKKRTR